MRRRPHPGAVNKPAAQRRRGTARFTPVVGAAEGDAVSGVGPTMPAEVAAHNPSITPPTSVLPADVSMLPTHTASGTDEFLNDFAFNLENANADFDWSNADFAGLESDLVCDWGISAGLTGV